MRIANKQSKAGKKRASARGRSGGWRSDSTGKIEVKPMTHAPPNAESDFGRGDKSCCDWDEA